MPDIYDAIIQDVRGLPKREPRPIPEQEKRTFKSRVKKVFTKSVSDAVEDIFDLVVRHAMGSREIESKIPISILQDRIAYHAPLIFSRSIRRGHFVRVMYLDNFLCVFDYGHGRVIELGAQIYRNPHPERESLAAIIVKESELVDPWDKVFQRDEIAFEFDLVDEHRHNGKEEPTIIDSVIWKDEDKIF